MRIADAGPGRVATVPAVAGWLQEAAAFHARALGFSNEAMGRAGVAWVLARLAIRMDRWPELGQRLRVATWPSSLERLRATRDFRILSPDGAVLGAATSVWVALDLVRRRAVPIPEFVAGCYPARAERALELDSKHLPEPDHAKTLASITTRNADLDENGHVNNVHLVQWAMEPLADLAQARPHKIDIAFRAECRHPDTVAAACAPQPDQQTILHTLTRSDATQLVRMRTLWPTLP